MVELKTGGWIDAKAQRRRSHNQNPRPLPAGRRVLGNDDPGERRTNDGGVQLLRPEINLALRHANLLLLAVQTGLQGTHLGLNTIEIGRRGNPVAGQLADPAIRERYSEMRY
jgi:hypothetical protein